MVRGRKAIEEWLPIHDDELIFRANKVVAHAVSAASSIQIYIGDDQNISCFIQRPGINQFDFSNIARLSLEWLSYVASERDRMIKELQPLLSEQDRAAPRFDISPMTAKLDINAARAKRERRPSIIS